MVRVSRRGGLPVVEQSRALVDHTAPLSPLVPLTESFQCCAGCVAWLAAEERWLLRGATRSMRCWYAWRCSY